ncbi:MAG TPA: hypothetical protein VJ870_05270 [Amycolatopsis sp.]|nr:hypothetical protein [Amycolatopsis sp.]
MTNPQPPGTQQGSGPYTSPEQALQQQLIGQGYDPNSKQFWDVFSNMIAQAKAQAAASQGRAQQSQQLSQGVDFRSGLPASDTDYQGIDHAALKEMVQTVDPAQVTAVSSSWTDIANAMATFGQQLQHAATKSGATWKGDAAESAYHFVSGLGKWSDDSGKAAQLASDQIYNQSSAAETAKNSMPDPIPFSWSDEVKSWASSNPFNLVDNIKQSAQKAQQSQDAHDQAAQVMSTYDGNLHTAVAQAPAFSSPPTFGSPAAVSTGQVPGSIGSVGSGVGSVGGSVGGPAGSGEHSGSVGGSSGSVSGSLAGLTGAPSSSLAAGAKTGGGYNSGTSAQSYQSPNSNFNSSAPGNSYNNLSALGGMPMGPMGGGLGGGGDDAYSSKLGRGAGGGFGPGGSGSAAGSGSATGSGAQTGAGARAGGAGAAESAAAGGRGAAGSSGRSGMSGMGGHGGKGEGGEDEEHQRPSWLIEPDPDDIFGTSERTAPPVIGE